MARRTPQEKKRLSLLRDRRNTYGENHESSLKNIRRGKQRGQMQLRRAVAQELRVTGDMTPTLIDETASTVAAVHTARGHRLFKKAPDTPLGEVLERKRRRSRSVDH